MGGRAPGLLRPISSARKASHQGVSVLGVTVRMKEKHPIERFPWCPYETACRFSSVNTLRSAAGHPKCPLRDDHAGISL
jgi:hypothetical protein